MAALSRTLTAAAAGIAAERDAVDTFRLVVQEVWVSSASAAPALPSRGVTSSVLLLLRLTGEMRLAALLAQTVMSARSASNGDTGLFVSPSRLKLLATVEEITAVKIARSAIKRELANQIVSTA